MNKPTAPDSQGTSTRPYLIRALHDWCTDNGFTPYVAVYVDASVQVPMEYVKNNEIVLNVGFEATSGAEAGQRVHRVQGPLRWHGARNRRADRSRGGDLRARERAGHGLPGAHRARCDAAAHAGRRAQPAAGSARARIAAGQHRGGDRSARGHRRARADRTSRPSPPARGPSLKRIK